MECAALSSCLISQPRGLVRVTGLESAGFTIFAIFLFASRPGMNLVKSVAAGLRLWESRERFPSLAPARRQLQAGASAGTVTSSGGRYGSPLNSTAHAMRASLLARATATTLV